MRPALAITFATFITVTITSVTPLFGQTTQGMARLGGQTSAAKVTESVAVAAPRFQPQFRVTSAVGVPVDQALATAGALREFGRDASSDTSSRPRSLIGLYAMLGATQAADMFSTRSALSHGAVETNPTMSGSMAQQVVVKMAVTTSTIAVAEKLWKKNKVAAIGLMVATNATMAMIAAHNVHNAHLGVRQGL